MNFLKKLLGLHTNDLKTIIKEKSDDGEIIQHILPFLGKLLNTFVFKFYKTDYKHKQFWVETISNKLHIKHVYIGHNIIVVFYGNEVISIVFDWIGLKELVSIFETNSILLDDNFKRKLFLLKYDIEKHLTNLSNNYKEVLDNFENIIIKNDVVELCRVIIPNKAYINKNRIVDIPSECAIPITKIIIYTDPSGLISSVNIIGKHPNADEKGWFCLGNLKMSPFCIETINCLIEQIKYYKLDDCYWRPNNYNDW